MVSSNDELSHAFTNSMALIERMHAGEPLGPAMGLSLQAQEELYSRAYTFYNQAKYADALRIFGHLMLAHHMDRRYFKGYAACLHMQQRHQEALKYYGGASMLDLTDPEPVIHMAECHLALGDIAQARASLDYALAQARGHETHRRFVARIEAMLQFLGTKQAAESAATTTGESA